MADGAAERIAERTRPRTFFGESAGLGGPGGAAERVANGVARRSRGVSDEEFAARQVGQETISGESITAGQRFLMGLLGDTFEEREAVFKQTNPGGELVEISGTDITLFRNDPTEQFRRINQPFLESVISPGFLKETGRDISGIIGAEGPNIVGEAVGLAVGKRPGGGRFLKDLLRIGAGGAGGEIAQQKVQEVAGTQRETSGEIGTRVVQEGVISVIGQTVGAGAGAALNLARGKAIFSITPEGARAIKAAERLGVDEPLPIQLVDSPFLKILGKQAQALLPRINRALRKQQEQLRAALRSASNRISRTRLLGNAARAMETANREVKSLLLSVSRSGRKNYRQAAQGLEEVVTKWWRSSGDTVDALYNNSRAIEEPRFDLTPALEAAERVSEGVKGVGRGGEAVQLRSIEGQLTKAVETIKQLDPDLPTVEGFASPLEVLRELRANLRDLTLPGPEGPRRSNALARELRDAVEEVIENASHQSPEAVAAYKKAQKAAAQRFQTREQAAVIDLLNTEQPSAFARSLVNPGSVDNLIALTRAGGKDALEEVQDLFISDLQRDPAGITAKLASFDEPTLNLLLPKDKRAVVKRAAKQMDELVASNIPKAVGRQTRIRNFVKDLIDTDATASLRALSGVISRRGGRDGPLGKSVRAAIIDEVWQRSQVVLESSSGLGAGFRKIDAKRLNAVLDDFNERGVLQFLTIGEKKLLRNTQLVQQVADAFAADAGVSIAASSAVAGGRQLSPSAFRTFFENFTVGKFMVGERGRDILIGTAAGRSAPTDTAMFKLIGAIAGNLTTTINAEKDLPDDFEEKIKGTK